jgi:hypothetical protein
VAKRNRGRRDSSRRRSDQFKTRRGRAGPKLTDCSGCRVCDLLGIPVLGLWVDNDVIPYSEEPGASHSGPLFDQTPVAARSDLPWTF